MKTARNDLPTKTGAIAGSLLAWFPLVAPLVLSGAVWVRARVLLFDYLMPAELYPFGLAGALLLLWVAFRARRYRFAVAWSTGAGLVSLVGGQGIAVAAGLADGRTPAFGPWWVVVIITLVLHAVAMLVTAAAGLMLVRALLWPSASTQP